MCQFCATDPPSSGRSNGPAIGGARRALQVPECTNLTDRHTPTWLVDPRTGPHFACRCPYTELADFTTPCGWCMCRTSPPASIHEVGDGRPT